MSCQEGEREGAGKDMKAKTHLNKKLTLASTYEIPSSMDDNRNSLTYTLKIGENLMMSYQPITFSSSSVQKDDVQNAHLGNSERFPELCPNLQKKKERICITDPL